jgi:two-component sensor histidine kinase
MDITQGTAKMITGLYDYMPHGMCLLWEPWLVLLWGGSDILICLSYFAIPLALFRVMRARKDIRHRGLILLFASFILLCGITHAVSVVTLWLPIYPLQAMIKLATGVVSAITAFVLLSLVPTIIAIPSRNDLEQANEKLRAEVAAHEETLADLRRARADLEQKVDERTAELIDVNAKLAVTAQEAVHRSGNLISVVSSLARQTARGQTRMDAFLTSFQGRLKALADATATVLQGSSKGSADLAEVARIQLQPVLLTFGEKIRISGPKLEIGPDAAQQISLALHELATNAHKYGTLTAPDAGIDLQWSLSDSKHQDQRLILRWQEDLAHEAKLADEAGSGGFGTQLLTRIVPVTLQGTAELNLVEGRLSYVLDVPMNSVRPKHGIQSDAEVLSDILGKAYGAA